MDQERFGKFILNLRKEKNLTQNDVAQKLGVTDKAVSKWERGLGCPDISLLVPLSNILGISVNELLLQEKIDIKEPAQQLGIAAAGLFSIPLIRFFIIPMQHNMESISYHSSPHGNYIYGKDRYGHQKGETHVKY